MTTTSPPTAAQQARALVEEALRLLNADTDAWPELLTLAQGARYTGRSVTFIRNLIETGVIPSFKEEGEKYRYIRRDDLAPHIRPTRGGRREGGR